jgi:hypothetical protein
MFGTRLDATYKPTEQMKRGGGVSSRRKTETKVERKEWRNMGMEMQLGKMYSIPWDMGRSGQSWHRHATGRTGDWEWAHMCWLNVHL